MADMRHRDGKVKVMHTIIGDFGRVLREIATLDEVESILTGTISPSKSYKDSLTFQYFTDNGLKLLAKTTIAVQEIFIVTTSPDLLLDELRKMGFVQAEREDVKHSSAGNRRGRAQRARADIDARRAESQEAQEMAAWESGEAAGQDARGRRSGKGAGASAKKAAPNAEADPLTLRQLLDPAALAALMKVKEEATPKERLTPPTSGSANAQRSSAGKSSGRGFGKDRRTRVDSAEEEDFAALFLPKDEEESFEDLLNKSKLDPKFFK